jgi:hypothetical protein
MSQVWMGKMTEKLDLFTEVTPKLLYDMAADGDIELMRAAGVEEKTPPICFLAIGESGNVELIKYLGRLQKINWSAVIRGASSHPGPLYDIAFAEIPEDKALLEDLMELACRGRFTHRARQLHKMGIEYPTKLICAEGLVELFPDMKITSEDYDFCLEHLSKCSSALAYLEDKVFTTFEAQSSTFEEILEKYKSFIAALEATSDEWLSKKYEEFGRNAFAVLIHIPLQRLTGVIRSQPAYEFALSMSQYGSPAYLPNEDFTDFKGDWIRWIIKNPHMMLWFKKQTVETRERLGLLKN